MTSVVCDSSELSINWWAKAMVQRKKAAKSKSKPRLKPRITSKRSRAALADPECLGADVNALVTQHLVGIAKRQLSGLRSAVV